MVAVLPCSPHVSVHPAPVPVVVIARVHVASVPSPPLSVPVPVLILVSVLLLALLSSSLLSAPSFGAMMLVAVDWGALVVMCLHPPYLPVHPIVVCSTHGPPHEHLLAAAGTDAGSSMGGGVGLSSSLTCNWEWCWWCSSLSCLPFPPVCLCIWVVLDPCHPDPCHPSHPTSRGL